MDDVLERATLGHAILVGTLGRHVPQVARIGLAVVDVVEALLVHRSASDYRLATGGELAVVGVEIHPVLQHLVAGIPPRIVIQAACFGSAMICSVLGTR